MNYNDIVIYICKAHVGLSPVPNYKTGQNIMHDDIIIDMLRIIISTSVLFILF